MCTGYKSTVTISLCIWNHGLLLKFYNSVTPVEKEQPFLTDEASSVCTKYLPILFLLFHASLDKRSVIERLIWNMLMFLKGYVH